MKKENVLFGVIGLLLGLIIGFVFANSVNQRGFGTRAVTPAAAGQDDLPPDHPSLASNGVAEQGGMQPVVQAAIQKAKDQPNSFDAQMEAAQMYYQIRRYDEALQYLLRANQIQPDNYEAIVSLGNTNFDSQNYEAAEKWYNAALAKKSDDINVRTDLGLTFMFRTQPDYDRAIQEFRKSLAQNPNHEQTLQDIVVALTKKGNAKEAQAMFDKLVQVSPQNPAIPELRRNLDTLKGAGTAGGKQ
jgi:tetratricopeptide (TPR) repeat protein